jgi:hypothetical protein
MAVTCRSPGKSTGWTASVDPSIRASSGPRPYRATHRPAEVAASRLTPGSSTRPSDTYPSRSMSVTAVLCPVATQTPCGPEAMAPGQSSPFPKRRCIVGS